MLRSDCSSISRDWTVLLMVVISVLDVCRVSVLVFTSLFRVSVCMGPKTFFFFVKSQHSYWVNLFYSVSLMVNSIYL